ncbi:MAG: MATE family efflux transporter, partial [Clostridiaceae bacterium]|nr:MATE family efflux transporter [Clostridiaceae bacterium]
MNEQQQMNKMGTQPIQKLMLSMGIPMILSMMMQALYNIVDSAFVSNMKGNGEMALNALTLAFPVQMLMVAVGIGTGVGMNALLAKTLGQRRFQQANHVAGNAIFLGIIIYIICVIFGVAGVRFYVYSQTKDSVIAGMAVQYLQICCIISLGIVFFSIFEKMLQATGKALYSTIAQIAGAVTNIILDPILIYGLIGLPEFGVKGAAYATVIGQIVSFVVAAVFHFTKNKEVQISASDLRPDGKLIKQIYLIGLPAIIAQALMSFMTYGLNIILVKINANVVTAYGLFYKIQQFVLFAAFGLRDVITPVVSYNYGMGSKERVKSGIKYGLLYTTIIMVIGMLALEIFASPFAAVFGLSGETQALCISAMRVISVSFLFAGANIAFQGAFQALEGGGQSLIISVMRQLLFVLPVAAFLVNIIQNQGAAVWLVWLTFPFAEIVSFVFAFIFMKQIYKKKNLVQKVKSG